MLTKRTSTTNTAFDRSVTGPYIPVSEIPWNMWRVVILINLTSIVYGYVMCAMNACLAVGNKGSGAACFNGDDDQNPSCPEGTLYDSLNLGKSKYDNEHVAYLIFTQ